LFEKFAQNVAVQTGPSCRHNVGSQAVFSVRVRARNHHRFAHTTVLGKHGFNLDPMAAAKANLILPDAEQPLPREDVLGKHVKGDHCTLVVDLTLKDFTNG